MASNSIRQQHSTIRVYTIEENISRALEALHWNDRLEQPDVFESIRNNPLDVEGVFHKNRGIGTQQGTKRQAFHKHPLVRRHHVGTR